MPWFRQPHRLLSRLLGLGTTVWLCRKVGCWARSFGRLGALVLRFVHRGRPQRRIPDYGHLLLDALYPGKRPTEQAVSKARELAAESRTLEVPEEALALLGQAMLLSPPDASLFLARTEAHTRRRQLVEALDDAEICVSLDAACAAGWLAKGEAERALGRTADAAFSYQAGLRAEPNHPELLARLAAVRAEPPPNLLRQLRDLVFAARLGLENLFRTVEDPEKTTDAFVESNSSLLDAQIGLLAQTLRVNTTVLFDSPMLCDAYEQIVYACAQLVAGAPAAFSTRLQNASDVIEGLSLALRVGWHVHHSVPKLAANALATLAVCPNADDALRRQAVRHLLGGMLRWLLDARPEPDREGEEVCGCSCTVPWKAAACFLERLFEPGRPPLWVREECECWPDAAQLCQWLTLSVRDYHATPLGLVGLLQLPGVAAAVMRSEAIVDFFIPAPAIEDDDFDASDTHSLQTGWPGSSQLSFASASSSGGAQPRQQAMQASVSHELAMGTSGMTEAAMAPQIATAIGSSPVSHLHNVLGDEEPVLPPPQRLGEWLIASVGYLLLFIEGDVLFIVCACRALQALAAGDPENGNSRLLRGLWLGVPLLNKLSLFACNHTAALDLLHCLLRGPHSGVRVAGRSLAHALARPLPNEPSVALLSSKPGTGSNDARVVGERSMPERASPDVKPATDSPTEEVSFEAAIAAATAALAAAASSAMVPTTEEHLPEEDTVPSWAEFYQELLNELASPSDKGEPPELVTLLNFEEKACFLAECAKVCVLTGEAEAEAEDDSMERRSSPMSVSRAFLDYTAVPSAWNRFTEPPGQGNPLSLFHGTENDAEIGSEEYISDDRKRGKIVLMSRSSIRQSSRVQNWAQAVTAAEKAGASAVLVFNNLDAMEPFRMGLFGEQSPTIAAFMVSGADGAALSVAASRGCQVEMRRSTHEATSSVVDDKDALPPPPPWPLTGGRLPADVAQAWSLLEAMSSYEPSVQVELEALLHRMSVPEKRVWLTRRLVRHHRSQQAPDGGLEEPPLAFVEGDRSLTPGGQLSEVRRQMCEATGLGAEDICGEFEVRFKDEQGVGSAVLREWMDMVAHEAYLHPGHRILRSYDRRQSFLPDPAAPFCNPQWQMDYEALGRLLGLALWQSCTLDLPLHPHLFSRLCGFDEVACEDIELSDLKRVDEDLYLMKVQWLLENSVEDLGFDLPFSDPLSYEEARDEATNDTSEQPLVLPPVVSLHDRCPGTVRSWPGKPLYVVGNAEVDLSAIDAPAKVDAHCEEESSLEQRVPPTVTNENKAAFVKALVDWRLLRCMQPQVEAMARGLRTVVPESVLCELRSLLSATEVSQLLCGLGEIDVDNWEAHCAYSQGLTRDADISRWFWRLVRDWSQSEEDRGKLPQLLQFVTGSARVPVGGFAELVGFNGAKHPFTLSRGVHLTTDSLPMAHACICTLDLPSYEDENRCRAKLTQMLSLGRSHFDETAGHGED